MLYNANQEEQKILDFWKQNDTFKKSLENCPEDKPYAFYDGPPFATGLPHYGHFAPLVMKDMVPRFWTMKGYRVDRKWGWDCHGLPVENIIEKELNLASKKDIEEYGVDKFNEACRATVLKFAKEWRTTVERMGRWVDMDLDYKTMDVPYMESVWWVFRQLWDKGLIYQGYKPMHICPRCVTPLSNFEVTQGYKDIKDISVTVKLKVKGKTEKIGVDGTVYILAWTTTPWTLPGNVLAAVGKDIEYVVVKEIGEHTDYFIVAKERLNEVFKDHVFDVVKEMKGEDLVGLEYEPLFSYYKNTPNAFRVVAADFVSTEDGTGVVHIAPAFGEDDFAVGQKENLPLVQHVGMDGHFKPEVTDFPGLEVKPKDDPTKTDVEIIKWLAHQGKLFKKEKAEHSYPHCWRCDTPLLNYATSSWFVRVTELKEQLLKNNEQIKWVPEHIKEGRFGKWLEGARDWAISRNRFWGTPLPVWVCTSQKNPPSEGGEGGVQSSHADCNAVKVIGSVNELEQLTGKKVTDLHKHLIDNLTFNCEKCGGTMKRIPEVLDCWFESGSMPYAQMHYPFENKEKFEKSFPAEFIAEAVDQTRGWFYTLHILATALTSGPNPTIQKDSSCPAFKNVVVNGHVLAADGKKMSKKLKNYPDTKEVIEKYGADALRFYLMASPVMYAESMNFTEADVKEVYSKLVNTLWNVFEFYQMFEEQIFDVRDHKSSNVLDQWILAKLKVLVNQVTENMENYKLAEAARPILDFITELSQWYVRRSRERLKNGDEQEKKCALFTLKKVLLTLSKIMAPFTPFIAEKIYQNIKQDEDRSKGGYHMSVHLEHWPKEHEIEHVEGILERMDLARKIVEMGLALRAEKKMKVRQPLSKLIINTEALSKELREIVADELNVKSVEYADAVEEENLVLKEEGKLKVWLDVQMTDELKKEGLVRDLIRTINQMRKDQGLTIEDKVKVMFETESRELKEVLEKFGEEIKKNTLMEAIEEGGNEGVEKKVDEFVVKILIVKV